MLLQHFGPKLKLQPKHNLCLLIYSAIGFLQWLWRMKKWLCCILLMEIINISTSIRVINSHNASIMLENIISIVEFIQCT